MVFGRNCPLLFLALGQTFTLGPGRAIFGFFCFFAGGCGGWTSSVASFAISLQAWEKQEGRAEGGTTTGARDPPGEEAAGEDVLTVGAGGADGTDEDTDDGGTAGVNDGGAGTVGGRAEGAGRAAGTNDGAAAAATGVDTAGSSASRLITTVVGGRRAVGLQSAGSGRAFLEQGFALCGCGGGGTIGIRGSSLALSRFRANSLERKARSAAFFESRRALLMRLRSFSSSPVASTLKPMSNRVSPLFPRRI